MEGLSNVSVFDTAEQVALAAAEAFAGCAHDTIEDCGVFSVVLSGGNTPRRVYELLATERFGNRVEWANVYFFFGDERCVPPDHPDSNYRMAYESLISKVAIPAKNVHRMIGEGNPPDDAAAYEYYLRTFFAGCSWPRFDLVFLGMGEDGHTASLFPGSEALNENSKWVVVSKTERFPHERITLTLPVFNHAARVMFLVTGKEKAARLNEVLPPQAGSEGSGQWAVSGGQNSVPAQMIQPVDGTVEWLVDSAAASLL